MNRATTQTNQKTTMTTTTISPQQVMDEARSEMRRRGFLGRGNEESLCLHWAGCCLLVLRRQTDLNPQLQGGSTFWKANDLPEPHPTNFGYQWDWKLAKPRLLNSLLPESHFWVGIPSTGEIVDLTTGFQEKQARVTCGGSIKWEDRYRLPTIIWDRADLLAERGSCYMPDLRACHVGYHLLLTALDFTKPEVGLQ
jgi:hypothetical protein